MSGGTAVLSYLLLLVILKFVGNIGTTVPVLPFRGIGMLQTATPSYENTYHVTLIATTFTVTPTTLTTFGLLL